MEKPKLMVKAIRKAAKTDLKHISNKDISIIAEAINSLYEKEIQSLAFTFKARRRKLKYSLRYVAKEIGVSHITISRVERGIKCSSYIIKELDKWYLSKNV